MLKMNRQPRVQLRAYEKADLARVFSLHNDPELFRLLNDTAVLPISLQEEAAQLDRCISPKNKDLSYTFALTAVAGRKAAPVLIGHCGYFKVSHKNRTCEIFISIADKNYRGKGYGTAALRKLLEFLFLEKNMRKVLLHVYSFNKRAIVCYEKLGFSQEGCLREHLYRDGKYHDVHIMALFCDDSIKK